MSAFAGAQGLENLSSAQQDDRSRVNIADAGLARRPSAPPSTLSRILFVPPQSNTEFRGSVLDVSERYQRVIHQSTLGGSEVIDAQMGSRLYMGRLRILNREIGEMNEKVAEYAMSAAVGDTAAELTLQRPSDDNIITVRLSDATDDFLLVSASQTIEARSSFPVPATVSSSGTSQHPFYTHSNNDGSKTLEWQIEPLVTGPLRYTLVEIDPAIANTDDAPPKPENIRAVYHHISQAPSLSLCSGEGVLLLPANDGTGDDEQLAVASLLGLLWRARSMQIKPRPGDSEPEKKSLLRRLF